MAAKRRSTDECRAYDLSPARIWKQWSASLAAIVAATLLALLHVYRPGGVRQQFKAVLPMVETMLTGLKTEPGLEGTLSGNIWDQGDAVGAWTGKALNVIVFPTGEVMSRMMKLAEQHPDSLMIIINPQWALSQQVVSDFGMFGRAKAERFLAEFQDTYSLRSYTIRGDNIRVLRCFPGQWQVHLVNPASGDSVFVHATETRPSYKLLQDTIAKVEGSNSSRPFAERLQRELKFNQDSLQNRN